jgi:hypothetical protein
MRHVHHLTAQTKNAAVQFGPLEQHLAVDRFQGIGEVKMAVNEWLRIQGPDICHEGVFKLVPRWERCISVFGDYAE